MLKEKGFEVEVASTNGPVARADLLGKVKGIDALLSLLTDRIDAEVFEAAGPSLKIVANYAVGFDNIDVSEAKKRGVLVSFTPYADRVIEPVAEHAMLLILAVAKKLIAADKFVRDGHYKGFDPNLFLGEGIGGKILGIVGLGRIGSHLAKIARGFDLKILYSDERRNEKIERELGLGFTDLETLLKTSDFISLHVPLLPQTKHLIDSSKLLLMKPTAILINTSRGPVVDEKALAKALQEGTIAGAGLDVYEFEPQLTEGLTDLPNVVLTPHTASSTVEARFAMSRMCAENIIAALEGKTPPNLVEV